MILLIDTSSSELLLGIGTKEGKLIAFFHAIAQLHERGIHDSRLASETDTLLRTNNITPDSIERIGIVIGPGSFTGLRIGLSFAKGFASATGSAIVPIVAHELYTDKSRSREAMILRPSYKDEFVYVARNGSPRSVVLEKRAELLDEDVIAPTIFAPQILLARLLTLALLDEVSPNIAELEPLYVTGFSASGAT